MPHRLKATDQGLNATFNPDMSSVEFEAICIVRVHLSRLPIPE